MCEIGGYIELDNYNGKMLHGDAIALNCGRNALAYIIEARGIKELWIPYYNCEVIANVCRKYGAKVNYYHIDAQFLPVDLPNNKNITLYLVNYYGQLSVEYITTLQKKYKHVIVDNAQAYFSEPISGVDTLYTCRKFFGVSDGAVLYTDKVLTRKLSRDESFARIHYILGRYERNATEFYKESSDNNSFFDNEPIKQMSKLTRNLLRGIDYDRVRQIRTENFTYLHKKLGGINQLRLRPIEGAFMYPLMLDNAVELRKKLIQQKIYVPFLWPNVVDELPQDWWEWKLANNVLPLPCDQRYGTEEMERICEVLDNGES